MAKNQPQTVTGIVVNQKINLNRRDYDHLKSTLHHLKDPKDSRRHDLQFIQRRSGRIAWAEALNPARGAKLRQKLIQVLES